MERTAKTMRARHSREIAALQARCKHPKTKWMSSMWAPGHISGEVFVCLTCEKVLKEKLDAPPNATFTANADGKAWFPTKGK